MSTPPQPAHNDVDAATKAVQEASQEAFRQLLLDVATRSASRTGPSSFSRSRLPPLPPSNSRIDDTTTKSPSEPPQGSFGTIVQEAFNNIAARQEADNVEIASDYSLESEDDSDDAESEELSAEEEEPPSGVWPGTQKHTGRKQRGADSKNKVIPGGRGMVRLPLHVYPSSSSPRELILSWRKLNSLLLSLSEDPSDTVCA
jgi:hypothetical protein